MKDEFEASVIIPTKDRFHEIYRCICSILKQTLLPHEIIIVDSGEKRPVSSLLKAKFPLSPSGIKCIQAKVPLVGARNIGIRHSSGDILFFFDDDVVLHRDYIREVVKTFINDKDSKIKGVMGDIVNRKRLVDSLGNMLLRLFFLAHYGDGKFLPSGFPTWVYGEKKALETEFLPGCMMAFKKDVFREFMFDEKLGKLSGYCYLEDVDFCYRVSRKYAFTYTPLAKLEHHLSRTTRVDTVVKKRQWVLNYFYLFKKNIPKNLSNVFAFCLSIFGLIIMTYLERDPNAIVGLFLGIKDMSKVSRLLEDEKQI